MLKSGTFAALFRILPDVTLMRLPALKALRPRAYKYGVFDLAAPIR